MSYMRIIRRRFIRRALRYIGVSVLFVLMFCTFLFLFGEKAPIVLTLEMNNLEQKTDMLQIFWRSQDGRYSETMSRRLGLAPGSNKVSVDLDVVPAFLRIDPTNGAGRTQLLRVCLHTLFPLSCLASGEDLQAKIVRSTHIDTLHYDIQGVSIQTHQNDPWIEMYVSEDIPQRILIIGLIVALVPSALLTVVFVKWGAPAYIFMYRYWRLAPRLLLQQSQSWFALICNYSKRVYVTIKDTPRFIQNLFNKNFLKRIGIYGGSLLIVCFMFGAFLLLLEKYLPFTLRVEVNNLEQKKDTLQIFWRMQDAQYTEKASTRLPISFGLNAASMAVAPIPHFVRLDPTSGAGSVQLLRVCFSSIFPLTCLSSGEELKAQMVRSYNIDEIHYGDKAVSIKTRQNDPWVEMRVPENLSQRMRLMARLIALGLSILVTAGVVTLWPFALARVHALQKKKAVAL